MKRGNSFMNKKANSFMYAFLGILALIVILIIIYAILPSSSEQTFTSPKDILSTSFHPSSEVGTNALGVFGNILGFIIGGIPNNIIASSGKIGALIILFAFWIMLTLIFGDILKNFSTLSSGISWWVAILLVIIAANLKFLGSFIGVLTGLFVGLGTFAVYASLFSSFIVFFAVEWGIGAMAPWIMRRKGMQRALKSQENTRTILNAITHYKQVGRALSTP